MNFFPCLLRDAAQGVQRGGRIETNFLAKLSVDRSFQCLIFLNQALRQRPESFILVLKEGPSGVSQQNSQFADAPFKYK